jgi:uncharacterized delta-60 repeat protein
MTSSISRIVRIFLYVAFCVTPGFCFGNEIPGELDLTFGSGSSINNGVFSAAQQLDGKWIIAGNFTRVNGAFRTALARLHPDGTTDHTWQGITGTNLSLTSVIIQPDDKILIAGHFTSINGVALNRIARLNPDGTIDPTFQQTVGANDTVYCLVLQPNGKILVGGEFYRFDNEERSGIVRLHPNGSVDTTFQSIPGSTIRCMAIQNDQKIVIGGYFSQVNGVARHNVARLNADGSLDTSYLNGVYGANEGVISLALQTDGKVLICGEFYSVNLTFRTNIARLNLTGSLDTSFVPSVSGSWYHPIRAVAVQNDGKILIGGTFSNVNGIAQNTFARLHPNGNLDTSFDSHMRADGQAVVFIKALPEGKTLVTGGFVSVNEKPRRGVAILNPDGSPDQNFENPTRGINGPVHSVTIQRDGKVLVAGQFTNAHGFTRNRIARFNSDGSLDAFQHGMAGIPTGTVYSILEQSDGKILVGGSLGTVNGSTRYSVARLYSDGSLESSFRPVIIGGGVRCLAVQNDGKILVGGSFTHAEGPRNRIAHLNADGSVDTSFQAGLSGANNTVLAIALQTDRKILISGYFNAVNGVPRKALARLHQNGEVDDSFIDTGTGGIEAIAIQRDGKILVGGGFEIFNGINKTFIARLNSDGSLDSTFNTSFLKTNLTHALDYIALQNSAILVSGKFTTVEGQTRRSIVRLNPDGSLERSFQDGMPGLQRNSYPDSAGSGYCMAVQNDGNIIVAGEFDQVNGVPCDNIARLYSGALPCDIGAPSFNDGTYSWTVFGQANRSYIVQVSNDLLEWSNLETVFTTNSTFQFTDTNSPTDTRFFRVKIE